MTGCPGRRATTKLVGCSAPGDIRLQPAEPAEQGDLSWQSLDGSRATSGAGTCGGDRRTAVPPAGRPGRFS